MPDVPEILHTETVARSRLFQVERVNLRFTNGVEVEYERVPGSRVGSVLVVPVLDDNTLLLVREYAAGTHRYELGFPKGVVESGEDVLDAANREIMEEVGYGARNLLRLDVMTIAPGYFGHTTHIVLAQDLYEKRLPGDEPEAIEVVPWSLHDWAGLLARDDFTEARSIASLFLARETLVGSVSR
ncbi:MAG: ADP compounds hydrolase NudE [Gammaproteobacteria bacterium]|nr:ADP compounds hydrolase NudE [Gammaproteobacteria bacterium]MCP5425811.1 ADP compounds hydrolase NudE [Gammaproteobacteria bacterium]MCP5458578.1 ADP compounds hydrolase NudE [Gammaproteobacteria bacterium]